MAGGYSQHYGQGGGGWSAVGGGVGGRGGMDMPNLQTLGWFNTVSCLEIIKLGK